MHNKATPLLAEPLCSTVSNCYVIDSLAWSITGNTQTRKMLALAGPASGRIATENCHQARSEKPRCRPFRITIGRDAKRPASFSVGCGILGSSCNTQTHHRRRRDDGDPRFENRLARDRASRAARASCGRRAWRGCGARRGSRRARVVCHAERRRGKLKRKRRSRVMVCVSVFVTHQEARGRF